MTVAQSVTPVGKGAECSACPWECPRRMVLVEVTALGRNEVYAVCPRCDYAGSEGPVMPRPE